VFALVSLLTNSIGAHATDTAQQSAPQLLASAGDALVKSGSIPLTSSTIADIAEAAAPSVVNIDTDSPGRKLSMGGMPFGFPLDFFFNGQRVQPKPDQDGKDNTLETPVRHGTGSGFIIRKDGYILTNNHVINKTSKITVTLNDKRKFEGTVVGTDAFTDVAVIKINADNLPALTMGTSATLRPGEFCIAVGSPMNLDHTVTFGIISAKDRHMLDINGNVNFIQTDAAINLGNSGGPLLNLAGEVIGVNTAILASGQNIGFSIPIDIVKTVAAQLIEHKFIERPWLGVGLADLDETVMKSLGIPVGTKGVVVESVYAKSPALQAGLQDGDVIEKIDGEPMANAKQLVDYVRGHKVRDTLNMAVWRAGALKAFAVVLGQIPDHIGTPLEED
jgi:serine protease Do